jgi:biopolymer transport protein TolR
MNSSRRAKRMARHHRGAHSEEGLILTSVIDIFTILVFFLLFQMGEESVLQTPAEIKLPESISDQKPDNALVVMISGEDVLVQGQSVMKAAAAEASESDSLAPLLAELAAQRQNRLLGVSEAEAEKHPAIIMGDKKIPYRLLKKVMYTLAEARYTDISLAVVQKE